jgi:predicted GH43/DUF377 family glycosyl hydrolase
MHAHALQPTPILVDKEVIRVFCGFRDQAGVSRIGYVDLSAREPTRVIAYSRDPVLDIGLPGAFDDNGVVPSAVVASEDDLRLYYAGYQLHTKVRFTVFGGLALSRDSGKTFARFSCVPVMDRTDNEMLFRVPHTVLRDEQGWRIWYGGGSQFEQGAAKTLPVYDIRHTWSADGLSFPQMGQTVIRARPGEYRVGRPFVIREKGKFRMYFGASTEQDPYKLAYAESDDGLRWVRQDAKLGLELSEGGFDSKMMAYPAIIEAHGRRLMLYNGDAYGEAGFGMAELVQ